MIGFSSAYADLNERDHAEAVARVVGTQSSAAADRRLTARDGARHGGRAP